MMKWTGTIVLIAMLLLALASVAWGQEEEINTYVHGFTIFPQVIQTIMWSGAYLPVYTFCLVLPMSYLQRFTGFDTNLLFWIAVLWVGGLAANFAGYALAGDHGRWLACLIAAPLIFGWCVLICTRSWADLSLRESLIVAAVTVILCTPYFGPTWYVNPREKPRVDFDESRCPNEYRMARCPNASVTTFERICCTLPEQAAGGM